MGKLQLKEREFHFGWSVVKGLYKLTPHLFATPWITLFLVATTLILVVAQEVINYYSGMMIGKFYESLTKKDEAKFWKVFMKSSFYYLGQCAILALIFLSSWLLNIIMRKNLIGRLHSKYFKSKTFFNMNCVDDQAVDNPDQRICADATRVCELLCVNIIPVLLISPFTIAWYTRKTVMIAGGLSAGILYGYFLIGLIINRFLISPITKWSARVEKGEGDFRYKHMSVRGYSEEVAFLSGEDAEFSQCKNTFMELFRRLQVLVLWKFPGQFFQYFFDYYGGVLSYAIQVFPVFILHSYDKMDPFTFAGQISNNAFTFIYLINCFTKLTDLALNIGELGGNVLRVAEFFAYNADQDRLAIATTGIEEKSENSLEIENVSIYQINSTRILVDNLTLHVNRCKNLLVTGESGVGKSSLLRAVAGLWPVHQGLIVRNLSDSRIFYLPQRAYFPVGRLSLRQQIQYPNEPTSHDNRWETQANGSHESEDTFILGLLNLLDLGHLVAMSGGLDMPADFEWQDSLSGGEQQRLVLVRAVYHRPTLILMDEATCSVSVEMEQRMYNMLKKHSISYISVGHRTTLRSYHDNELQIRNGGAWNLSTLDNLKL